MGYSHSGTQGFSIKESIMPIQIAGKKISLQDEPFIIAEMSGNHNQSLDKALAIVDAAAAAGVSALKIQTYTADTMTIDVQSAGFVINDSDSLWKGNSLYSLYEKAHTPWEWHKPIFERCKKHGIIGFSSPFDESAVDFLETLGVPAYKVASFENADLKLIKRIARTKKPMIISTGMATLSELDETIRTAKENGCKDLILLKCTSTYPASAENTNLTTIAHMRDLFQVEVGLSDHTLGIGVAVAGVALGAVVVEKHFTLDRKEGGVDSAFSLEPHEMKALVNETKQAWLAKGKIAYGPTTPEQKSMQFRRTLYVVENIKAGETFNEKNVRAIRPGFGLAVKYYDVILGKKAKKDIKKGTPTNWDLIE